MINKNQQSLYLVLWELSVNGTIEYDKAQEYISILSKQEILFYHFHVTPYSDDYSQQYRDDLRELEWYDALYTWVPEDLISTIKILLTPNMYPDIELTEEAMDALNKLKPTRKKINGCNRTIHM